MIKEYLPEIKLWSKVVSYVGILSGLASALFLYGLQFVTQYRENHPWIIFGLPIAGFFIGFVYSKSGSKSVKGNNLILETFEEPTQKIPLIMAPLVLLSTWVSHLFGASVGREGTAVQMGAAISHSSKIWFNILENDYRMLIIMGISGGFASVFGTPFTAAIFALELFFYKKANIQAWILSFSTAIVAFFTVKLIGVPHTIYTVNEWPVWNISTIFWVILLGIIFGITAWLFSFNMHYWSKKFTEWIGYAPLRPVFGGIILMFLFDLMPLTEFMGLGIPVIQGSFEQQSPIFYFALKLLFTGFCLGCGFKGGEVTPLFFVGATLGSFLSGWIPLPLSFMAALGFIAVFSGATHTPLACSVMGIELFGFQGAAYWLLVCWIAYFCSGTKGIYSSQQILGPKKWMIAQLTNNKNNSNQEQEL